LNCSKRIQEKPRRDAALRWFPEESSRVQPGGSNPFRTVPFRPKPPKSGVSWQTGGKENDPAGRRRAGAHPWYAWHKAMVTVQVQLPEETFSALRRSPDEMAGDLRLAAAVHWYSRGLISQERAAQVAGLDRTDFILALAREGVDAFAVDMTSLRRELADG